MPTTWVDGPIDGKERMTAIASYPLFGADVRSLLDGHARDAARRFDQDFGIVSIVLDGAQLFAGSHGLGGWLHDAGGTPIEWSFCVHAVRTAAPYVVEDARLDDDQRANPLVLRDGIRSYAGAPLLVPSGHVLGACCVLGRRPRPFGPDEVAELERMATDVVADLERCRSAGAA